MTRGRFSLLAGLLCVAMLLFWRMPADITLLPQPQPAETKTTSAHAPSPESSAPQQSITVGKEVPICQQVLPDHDWHQTPQREAIRGYLYERLQQGDSPEQLLLMLRDQSSLDKGLSKRQAELQLDLEEMLIRYEESQLPRVPIGQYLDYFNRLRQKEPAEKIVLLRSAPEINLLFHTSAPPHPYPQTHTNTSTNTPQSKNKVT